MLTAKIYLAESGQVADLQKDFPVYQGQFQNILLNVFVPTSLLAANFMEKTEDYGDLTTPFVAGTAVKIAMRTVARNGAFKMSNDHYLRYVKTLMKDGISYALYERKMPREFTFYAGQGINAPTLIINVVNAKYGEITAATAVPSNTALTVTTNLDAIKNRLVPVAQKYVFTYNSEGSAWYIYGKEVGNAAELSKSYGVIVSGTPSDQDTITLTVEASEPAVTNISSSQIIRLDVMPSSDLDNDTAIEADEWDLVEATITSLTASINALVTAMPLKQDISDAELETADKTVVGAINEVNANTKDTDAEVDELQQRVSTLEQTVSTGETPIGTMTVTTLPTDAELSAFVEANTTPSRKPKPGDTIIVVLQIPDATDKNYKYIYSGETRSWNDYEIPPIELAANGTAGIVSGTYSMTAKGYNVLVDIMDGEIRDIYAKIGTDYVSVKTQLELLTTVKDNIISGTQTVGVAERAKADEAGNNILATYQTKASGATKQYVKDYALPKEFNNILYLARGGYQPTVPTEPANGIQIDAGVSTIGETKLFSIPYTLADVEFMLGAKNSYSNDFYIGVGEYPYGGETAQFRLVTLIKKGTNDPVEAAVELTDEITFDSLTPQKISMAAPMTLLGKNVYELEKDDQIIQELSVIRTTSEPILFFVFGNSTYPSNLHLYTGSVVVLEAAEVVQEEGTSPKQVMSQKAVTDALATKLGTPYGVDFPHGAATVTYDTTDGIHIRGTMRIYTSADKTLFVDVPNTEVEIPIKAGTNMLVDKAATGQFVEIKSVTTPTYEGVTVAEDGSPDANVAIGNNGITITDLGIPSIMQIINEAITVARLYSQGGTIKLSFPADNVATGTTVIVTLPTKSGTLALTTDVPSKGDYLTTDSAQTVEAKAAKTFEAGALILNETTEGMADIPAYCAVLPYYAHYNQLYFWNQYTNSLVKLSDFLNASNVKTLFGNQSIVGSGNIDLYRHLITLTCYSSTGKVVVHIMFISSKPQKIDSMTDLFTAMSDYAEEEYPATGYGNGSYSDIVIIGVTPSSTGGIVVNDGSGLPFTEEFGAAQGGQIEVTDTVTTV